MSPRRNRRRIDARTVQTGPRRSETVESWQGRDWVVRHLSGSAESRTYRCPGCDQEVPASTAHVVCWPAESGGVESRRHWHRACWQARDRRTPRVFRGRGGRF